MLYYIISYDVTCLLLSSLYIVAYHMTLYHIVLSHAEGRRREALAEDDEVVAQREGQAGGHEGRHALIE